MTTLDSTTTAIASTIAAAFAALDREPFHLETAKALRDDLDLANYELEERVKEIAKLEQRIDDLQQDRHDLRMTLDEANSARVLAAERNHELETTVRIQGHKIAELATDLDAERIRSGMLRDEIRLAEAQALDHTSTIDRLQSTLARIFGEAKEMLPAPEVVAATFPQSGIGHNSLVDDGNESDPVMVESVDEITAEPNPEPVKSPYTHWGF